MKLTRKYDLETPMLQSLISKWNSKRVIIARSKSRLVMKTLEKLRFHNPLSHRFPGGYHRGYHRPERIRGKGHYSDASQETQTSLSVDPAFISIEPALHFRAHFSADSTDVLSLGAFNVQVFGKSKMRKDGVLENLVAILSRYDVVLFQEIRDSSGTAIAGLMDALNAATGNQYAIELSERLGHIQQGAIRIYLQAVEGRGHYKLRVDDGAEPDNDAFEREPYVVHFSATQHDYDTLVGIHLAEACF